MGLGWDELGLPKTLPITHNILNIMIHIQSDRERTRPHHFDASCAMWGAIESGLDYRLTSFEEVESGKFDAHIRKSLFVGSVEFMREVFKRIGILDVRLPLNCDRKHETLTLGEVRKRAEAEEKLFIKPFQIKLFTGFVIDQCKYSCLNNIPDDTLLMVYKPFETKILSEWRIYVHNHKIVDSRNYSGDFKITPFYEWIVYRILDNKETFPISYTIDVGILDYHPKSKTYLMNSERNVICEYNDGWSLGSYGISNDLYLKLLTDRYFEIVK